MKSDLVIAMISATVRSGDGRDTDTYRAFRPIAIVSKLFGVFPVGGVFQERGHRFEASCCSPEPYYTGVVLLLLFGILIHAAPFGFIEDISRTLDPMSFYRTQIHYAVLTGYWIVTAVLSVILALGYPAHFHKWRAFENLKKYDTKPVAFEESPRPTPTHVRLMLTAAISFQFLTLLSDFIFACVEATPSSEVILIYLFYLIMVTIDIFPNVSFCYFCLALRNRFYLLSHKIGERFFNYNGSRHEEMNYFRRCFCHLVAIGRDVDRLFSPLMLVFFVSHTVLICTGLYYITIIDYTSGMNTRYSFVRMWLYSINSILRIIILCIMPSLVTKEIDEIRLSLMAVPTSLAPFRDEVQIQMVLMAATDPPLSFTAFKLFRINPYLITIIAAIVIVYVLLFVQFKIRFFI